MGILAFADNRLNIVNLDACRNNPYKRSFRSSAPGLARMDADAALQDAAILASLALQYGTPPAALARSMSRQPHSAWEPATAPASPVGAAMDLLARLDRGTA